MKKDGKVTYGISNKLNGQVDYRPDSTKEREGNKIKYFNSLGIDPSYIVGAGLVHGNNVTAVSKDDRGTTIPSVDGLVSNDEGVVLCLTVADCLPVYFYNVDKTVIGIAHAGWRGVVGSIVTEVLKKIDKEYGVSAQDMCIEIGPHIHPCHFRVQEDILDNFIDYPDCILRKNGEIFIDLAGIVKHQLRGCSVPEKQITLSDVCTHCNQDFFSYRRDRPEKVEVQTAWITMRG